MLYKLFQPMEGSLDVSRITAIVKLLSGTRVQELELQEGNSLIRVRRSAAAVPPPSAQAEAETVQLEPEEEKKVVRITSPVVGVFRRGADHAVGEGDVVRAGQTLASVESVRIFHPIRAPSAGTLLRFLVDDGAPVEYGQDLIEFEPETEHPSAHDDKRPSS